MTYILKESQGLIPIAYLYKITGLFSVFLGFYNIYYYIFFIRLGDSIYFSKDRLFNYSLSYFFMFVFLGNLIIFTQFISEVEEPYTLIIKDHESVSVDEVALGKLYTFEFLVTEKDGNGVWAKATVLKNDSLTSEDSKKVPIEITDEFIVEEMKGVILRELEVERKFIRGMHFGDEQPEVKLMFKDWNTFKELMGKG